MTIAVPDLKWLHLQLIWSMWVSRRKMLWDPVVLFSVEAGPGQGRAQGELEMPHSGATCQEG